MLIGADLKQLKSFFTFKRPMGFEGLTPWNQNQIKEDVKILINTFSPEKIYLMGSYSMGCEYSDDLPNDIKVLMKKVLGKTHSDRDYHIVPCVKKIITIGDIQVLPFKSIHAFEVWPNGVLLDC